MSATIRIPTPLRPMAGGQREVEVEGKSVRELIDNLAAAHSGIRERICDDSGAVRRFVNLFLNDEDIRTIKGLETEVKDGDVLSIVPAIAGGAPTIQDVLGQIRDRVEEVTPDQVRQMQGDKNGAGEVILLDVRDADEVAEGHLPGAVHLPKSFVELRIEQAIPDRSARVVAYCAGGVRSLLAADSIKRLGYDKVYSMKGGFGLWRREGHPVAKPKVLSAADRNRYKRHLTIPEVAEAGQIKLLESKVLLIGAGGLGCPTAYYLAAAGVGDPRYRRLRRRRRDEPPAPDPAHDRPGRHAEDRVGQDSAPRTQPGHHRQHPRGADHQRQRRAALLPSTTWSSMAATTSPPATSSTTPASCSTSPAYTAASTASRDRSPSSTHRPGHATAASTPSRHRPSWRPRAPRRACWACSPG